MRKFTIFSIILSVIILIMVAQVLLSEYLPQWQGEDFTFTEILSDEDGAKNTQASVLSNKLGEDVADSGTQVEFIVFEPEISPDFSEDSFLDAAYVSGSSGSLNYSDFTIKDFEERQTDNLLDFEDSGFSSYSPNAYLREEQLRAAGFSRAYFEEESDSGYLFKTIFVNDLKDVALRKFNVRDESLLYAKVYVFSPGYQINLDQLYKVIKARCTEGTTSETNETNQFGQASFYMNDSTRANTAFLTVKFSGLIYSFSYPKEYHKQLVNLIKLIGLEK